MSLKPPFGPIKKVSSPAALKSKDNKAGVVATTLGVTKENMLQGLQVGVSNTRKHISITSFSANGTVENRQNGSYGTFYGSVGGGVPDAFRDAQGKYWTYNTNGTNVTFLNPFVGNEYSDSSTVSKAYIPARVFYEQPTLVNPESTAWVEYEQRIYVTPDKNWLYKAFGERLFSRNSSKNQRTLGT